MKETLQEIYIDVFEDSALLGIFIWLITAVILFFVGYGSLYLIDSSFIPIKEGKGVVVEKYERAPYTSFVSSGKVMVPIHHPRTYHLVIEIDGLQDDNTFKEEFYNTIEQGNTLQCEYTEGRIWQTIYIKNIQ